MTNDEILDRLQETRATESVTRDLLIQRFRKMDGILVCCYRTLCQKSSRFVRKEAQRLLGEYIAETCPESPAASLGRAVKTAQSRYKRAGRLLRKAARLTAR